MENYELLKLAKEAKKNAIAKNTGYKVGAALLCTNGNVYTGSNIEHSISGLGACAEQVAFMKALSEGEREFEKIAVIGGMNENIDETLSPCGVCRQFMLDFAKNLAVVFYLDGKIVEKDLKYMMTDIFDLDEKEPK